MQDADGGSEPAVGGKATEKQKKKQSKRQEQAAAAEAEKQRQAQLELLLMDDRALQEAVRLGNNLHFSKCQQREMQNYFVTKEVAMEHYN